MRPDGSIERGETMHHNGKRIAYMSFAGDYQLYAGTVDRDGTPRLDSCNCETCSKARRKSIVEHMERAEQA